MGGGGGVAWGPIGHNLKFDKNGGVCLHERAPGPPRSLNAKSFDMNGRYGCCGGTTGNGSPEAPRGIGGVSGDRPLPNGKLFRNDSRTTDTPRHCYDLLKNGRCEICIIIVTCVYMYNMYNTFILRVVLWWASIGRKWNPHESVLSMRASNFLTRIVFRFFFFVVRKMCVFHRCDSMNVPFWLYIILNII